MEFPGFPSNNYDWHFEGAGGALAGMLLRSPTGEVFPGVLPRHGQLLSVGSGWTIRCAPFVAARASGRAVLLGGSTSDVIVDVDPAPAANARLDVIYSLPADMQAGDPERAVAVATGLPSAVPAKPSIPDGAIELGTFRVAAGNPNAAAAQLTETFPFAALAGGVVFARSTTALKAMQVPDGMIGYCIADRSKYERIGGEWVRQMRVWSKILTLKQAAANTPARVTVQLPAGLFTVTPAAVVTPQTSGPQLLDVSVGSPSANAVDVYMMRGNTVETDVHLVVTGY